MRRAALPLALTAALAGCGGGEDPPRVAAPTPAATPAPVAEPAAAPPPAPRQWRYTTARVARRTPLRARPGGRALARVGRWTEFGGPRYLGVTGRRGGWLRVVAPERPNGAHAWIPAERARLFGTDLSLHIDRSAHRLTVRRGDRVVRRVTVGVGRPGHETPLGRFAITDKLRMGGPGTTYGCCALALSGRQPRLPAGWSGGNRLAIHGTNRAGAVGGSLSTGCVHASDADLRKLMRTIPLGAPVFIRA